jgi:hypothetical protein
VLSGTRALDPVVLSGLIAALLPSRFWSASLPHGRLIGHLAIVLERIGDLHFYENGPSVNRETNLASIRTRLAPVAPGAICVPVRCGAAI